MLVAAADDFRQSICTDQRTPAWDASLSFLLLVARAFVFLWWTWPIVAITLFLTRRAWMPQRLPVAAALE